MQRKLHGSFGGGRREEDHDRYSPKAAGRGNGNQARRQREVGWGFSLCSCQIGVSTQKNISSLIQFFVNDMSLPSPSLPVVSLFWLACLCVYTLYIAFTTNGSVGS